MKYKYTVLFGILWGAVMLLIWSLVFSNIIEASGFGIGIALGIAFSCCGWIEVWFQRGMKDSSEELAVLLKGAGKQQ